MLLKTLKIKSSDCKHLGTVSPIAGEYCSVRSVDYLEERGYSVQTKEREKKNVMVAF